MPLWIASAAWAKEVLHMNFKKQFNEGLLTKNPVTVKPVMIAPMPPFASSL